MFSRIVTFAVLALPALVAFAEPIPQPNPAVYERQALSDVVNGATSVLNGATSVFGDVTGGAVSVFTQATGQYFPRTVVGMHHA
jgi:hypothetical protein